MATANEEILEATIGHQIDLERYSNSVLRRIMAELNRADIALMAELLAALERLPANSYTVQRLEKMLESVKDLNADAMAQATAGLLDEMKDLAEHEAGFQLSMFTRAIPAQVLGQIPLHVVNVEQVYAAAMARPFQGRILKDWGKEIAADKMAQIRQAIRIGYDTQQTTAKIVQSIRGTRANKFNDGVIQRSRREVETMVRAAVSHTAGLTRERFIEENSDIIAAKVWTSTLDSATSPICLVRDQTKYTAVGHKPIGHNLPWLGPPGRAHYNCRSTWCPAVKSFRDLGIDMDDMSPSTRASMDGQVPADMSYETWLRNQTQERQEEVLGVERARLFRAGAPLGKFVNDKGKLITLAQMRARAN